MLVLPLIAALAGEPTAHEWGVQLPLGLGMPTGLIGIALDWTPTPKFTLEGGLGADRTFSVLGDTGGFQWSFMPRLHLADSGPGLSIGAGISGGSYEWCDSCPFENGDRWRWSQAFWFNFEGALEYRWTSGWGLRLLGGGAKLLNPDNVTCEATRYNCEDVAPARQSIQPYFGFVVRVPLW